MDENYQGYLKHMCFEPEGLTTAELSRALEVSEEAINDYLVGITVTKDSHGEFIIPFADVQNARLHFKYGIDRPLD